MAVYTCWPVNVGAPLRPSAASDELAELQNVSTPREMVLWVTPWPVSSAGEEAVALLAAPVELEFGVTLGAEEAAPLAGEPLVAGATAEMSVGTVVVEPDTVVVVTTEPLDSSGAPFAAV